jgi:hypothetical protein
MIDLPDPGKAFDYENGFYLSCDASRIAKVAAAYELYKMSEGLPGELVECGVFKGTSLARFAMFRSLLGGPYSRRILGFDTFGEYPQTEYELDVPFRNRFISAAGDQSISAGQLHELLQSRGLGEGVELIAGDITETVPAYVKSHPELRISLLNLDTDIYEPAVTVLQHLYPLIVKGGLLVLDDYSVFPGETKAVEEYFKDQRVTIRKFAFARTPCYVVKS